MLNWMTDYAYEQPRTGQHDLSWVHVTQSDFSICSFSFSSNPRLYVLYSDLSWYSPDSLGHRSSITFFFHCPGGLPSMFISFLNHLILKNIPDIFTFAKYFTSLFNPHKDSAKWQTQSFIYKTSSSEDLCTLLGGGETKVSEAYCLPLKSSETPEGNSHQH